MVYLVVGCLACRHTTQMPPCRELYDGYSLQHRMPAVLGVVVGGRRIALTRAWRV